MSNDGARWDIYDKYLKRKMTSNREQSIEQAVNSFMELASSNPAYQENAECNGIITPIIALRKSSKVCTISLHPETNINIGDEIRCYGENWLVMELYEDEFGLKSGEIWLCNHLFRYQNHSYQIIEKYGIIDDGTYSKNTERPITVADARYPMYISLDNQTLPIHIDKRLAIGTMYNQNNEKILQVMKVTWIDTINQNNGQGSHLLKLQLTNDVFNKEKDNIELLICDYINYGATEQTTELVVSGKNTIRIGTTREYTLNTEENIDFIWSCDKEKVKIEGNGKICNVSVPFDESLIGEQILLVANSDGLSAKKILEVVSIG